MNSDPFRLTEPGGVLDVTNARYEQLNERTVRVTGSQWEPMPYTMKLGELWRSLFRRLC